MATALMLCALTAGCSRSWHRQRADERAYQLIESREIDPLWRIPSRTVEARPESRMADLNCADCGPKPLDDEAASQFTRQPNAVENGPYYDAIPTDPELDKRHWVQHLPRNEDGKVLLSEQTVVEIALLHSRDFQTQVEGLYLSGLGLSSERFEFQTQWFGGSNAGFAAASDAPNAIRTLTESNSVGFVQALAAGGEFTTSLANMFVWELGSNQFNMANGDLILGLTQPLLRGAFQHVRLNPLTLAERSLLYDVRDFARFRRAFYQTTITSYLNLLTQVQAKRNQERNLESLEVSLDEANERLARGLVSQFQYDQVFQEFQSGRIGLLATEQALDNAFDDFKFQLGLPAWIEIELDESLLEPFELSDPALVALQEDTQKLYQELTQVLPPEVPERKMLVDVHQQMLKLQQQAIDMLPQITEDVETWQKRLDELSADEIDEDDRVDVVQQKRVARQVGMLVKELKVDLDADLVIAKKWDVDDPVANRKLSDLFFTVDDYLAEGRAKDLEEEGRKLDGDDSVEDDKKKMTEDERLIASWTQLTRMLGRRLRERSANMFVVQTQTRLFFIDVKRTSIQQSAAVEYALRNRLDLKNEVGQMTDAFRNLEVAADQLESDLNVSLGANIATDNDNAFRFDSDANSYTVGVDFDGPLNRFNEGIGYRTSQIGFQASRRQVMATEDLITNQIRADLRALRISRLNFQIGRQQLIAAIRQVDVAQSSLRSATEDNAADSSPTRDLLDALSGLLSAKNGLIENRIGHEIARINLFVDLELLYLDDQGHWTNKDADPADFARRTLELAENADANAEKEQNSLEQERELPNDSQSEPDLKEAEAESSLELEDTDPYFAEPPRPEIEPELNSPLGVQP